jgi:hypothetical protein
MASGRAGPCDSQSSETKTAGCRRVAYAATCPGPSAAFRPAPPRNLGVTHTIARGGGWGRAGGDEVGNLGSLGDSLRRVLARRPPARRLTTLRLGVAGTGRVFCVGTYHSPGTVPIYPRAALTIATVSALVPSGGVDRAPPLLLSPNERRAVGGREFIR